MAGPKTDAQQAILEGIVRIAEDIKAFNSPQSEAEVIRNLAVAFRLAVGGTQPGAAIVDGRS